MGATPCKIPAGAIAVAGFAENNALSVACAALNKQSSAQRELSWGTLM
jgi:hypothetical protein